jgi:hypothetical protein
MATLALSTIGGAVGNMIVPGIGGMVGRAAGAVAGAYIDQQLLASSGQESTRRAPTVSDIQVSSSSEGDAIRRLYGRARVAGQVIWATYHEMEVSTTGGGSGKGMGGGSSATETTEYLYYANFAMALCEGEINRIGRIWADREEIDLSSYTYRVYTGTETQTADSLIQAKEGSANAPAFRGVAYIVFERFALKEFGKRVPNLEFEVFRAVDPFEAEVRGVTMIPAAGEYAYSPTEVRVDDGLGISYAENRHVNGAASDWAAAVDNLQAELPNAATVSLFVAWFGSDLRCGNCTVKPKIDNAVKPAQLPWGVSGLTRATAEVVTSHDGRPAYGGTPSDNTVIAAIQDLHTRGLGVIYTPFLMMDIPAGNTLPDPYTGAGTQPVYPWRGRITCSPAPGVSGTPDKTAAAATQVNAFYGTVTAADFTVTAGAVTYTGPAEWSYSRFVLHAAALCAAAGGVEAFVVGSEMRGLGWVRDSASTYPFVAKLQALAAQVSALLPGAQITYAADWSEYFGHQPGDGSNDVYFHLDPLWSDANIDAVAIDCYWPLSDWRDGTDHLDYQAGTQFIHDLTYLQGNIAGGEGYDWYYASDANRTSQTRTTITDGAGKPWVFRYKDVRSWWGNAHYNRPGGTESGTPTAWTPQGKPIWFTELGCPAVDKGSNQPNVFYDPKSAESARPYFSRGVRDDLIQRRYLRAMLEWYADAANNPASTVYTGRMVDTSRMMLYTWDARPYPAFPGLSYVWSDAVNWAANHWLCGRMSDAPLAETVERMLTDYGFTEFNAGQLSGSMAGYVIDSVTSARDALQPLETAFFFDSFESQGAVRFAHRGRAGVQASIAAPAGLIDDGRGGIYELRRGQETELPHVAKITYIDGDQEYEQKTAEGRRMTGGAVRVSQARLPVITTYAAARSMAETLVHEAECAREHAQFTLPPSMLALDATDIVALTSGAASWELRLRSLSLGEAILAEALSIERQLYDPFAAPTRDTTATEATSYGAADVAFLDLPLLRGDEVPYAGAVAAFASPWPGGVAVYRSPAASGYTLNTNLVAASTMGRTGTAFYSGPASRWDNGNVLRVTLSGGQLTSADELLVLGGANVAAVENADGEWEVIAFKTATLVSALTYDLSGLLRGLGGTEGAMRSPVAAGARFVLLDSTVRQVSMTQADVGLAYNWKYGPAPLDIGNAAYSTLLARAFTGVGLRPLSPCHVAGAFDGAGDLMLNWKRRTRTGGDSWEQSEVPLGEDAEAYEVDVMDGAVVKRTLTTASQTATYTAAQQVADFGGAQASYAVRVYQLSASYGRGARAEALVP